MVRFIRSHVQSALRRAGFSFIPYPLHVVLDHVKPDVVLDVGANDGGYGRELRARGYTGRIVSFEPLGDAFDALRETTSDDPTWECQNVALGRETGHAEIHRASNSASSSFHRPSESMAEAAPHLSFGSTETVSVQRLDTLIGDLASSDDRVFLKVDTQGFELDVLAGAEQSLGQIHAVQLETSFSPLYDGQPTIEEVFAWMRARGWVPGWVHPAYWTPGERRWVEADVLFVRA